MFSITLTLLLLCFFALLFIVFKRRRRKGEPPLVQHSIPFVGAAFDFGKDPMGYLRQIQSRHGDVFTIKLAGWNTTYFMNPLDVPIIAKSPTLDIKEILRDFVSRMVGDPHQFHTISKPKMSERVLQYVTPWRKSVPRHRNDAIPHLMVNNLRGTEPLSELCRSARTAVPRALYHALGDTVGKGYKQHFQLHELCKRLIFDVTFNILFGSLPEEGNQCRMETEEMFQQFCSYHKDSALLVDRVPIHFLPETKRARKRLFKSLENLDWSKRSNVSWLISDIVGVNPKLEFLHERVRHLLIILWSAQANTIPALFWCIFHILTNPEAKVAIKEEFASVLQSALHETDDNNNDNLTTDKNGEFPPMRLIRSLNKSTIDKLFTLDSCVKETMRICGTSMNLRRATDDAIIKTASGKKYLIRKGDYTAYYASCTHMDPEIFPNPTEYVYDRFVARSSDDVTSSMSDSSACSGIERHQKLRPFCRFYKKGKRVSASTAILTFGFGKTRCPGRHIAIIEIKLIILSLLTYFDIRLSSDKNENSIKEPGFDLRHVGFGVMPPEKDIDVTIAVR